MDLLTIFTGVGCAASEHLTRGQIILRMGETIMHVCEIANLRGVEIPFDNVLLSPEDLKLVVETTDLLLSQQPW